MSSAFLGKLRNSLHGPLARVVRDGDPFCLEKPQALAFIQELMACDTADLPKWDRTADRTWMKGKLAAMKDPRDIVSV